MIPIIFFIILLLAVIFSSCHFGDCPQGYAYCKNLGLDAKGNKICKASGSECCSEYNTGNYLEPDYCSIDNMVIDCYKKGKTCCGDCLNIPDFKCINGQCMNCTFPKTVCGRDEPVFGDIMKCCEASQYCVINDNADPDDLNKNQCVPNCIAPMKKCGKYCYTQSQLPGAKTCCNDSVLYWPRRECCPNPCSEGQICFVSPDPNVNAQCIPQKYCGAMKCGASKTDCCGGTICYDPKTQCCGAWDSQGNPKLGCDNSICVQSSTGGNAECKEACTCGPETYGGVETSCMGVTLASDCTVRQYDSAYCGVSGTDDSTQHTTGQLASYCSDISDPNSCNSDPNNFNGMRCEWKEAKYCSC